MASPVVNLAEKAQLIQDTWSPRVVAEMNDIQFKLVRLEGPFVWHAHADTDEAFLVLEGTLEIELPDTTVRIGPGELFVVPRGVQHRPVADEPCLAMLVEPRGVTNTGDAGGERTAENDRWI